MNTALVIVDNLDQISFGQFSRIRSRGKGSALCDRDDYRVMIFDTNYLEHKPLRTFCCGTRFDMVEVTGDVSSSNWAYLLSRTRGEVVSAPPFVEISVQLYQNRIVWQDHVYDFSEVTQDSFDEFVSDISALYFGDTLVLVDLEEIV